MEKKWFVAICKLLKVILTRTFTKLGSFCSNNHEYTGRVRSCVVARADEPVVCCHYFTASSIEYSQEERISRILNSQ